MLCGSSGTDAQTASPNTPPPRFPLAAKFDMRTSPASAAQHAAMVRIAAGIYLVGSPPDHPLANKAATPQHRVAIAAFRIDRTEVTNAQFAEFMNALPVKARGAALGGKVGPANIAPADRAMFLEFSSRPAPYTMIDLDDEEVRIGVCDGRFVPNPGHDNHPVTETTWAGALAYCHWRGGRLPTEIEWEAAARGVSGRAFPWGDSMPTPELAVVGLPSGTTIPVGSRPKGARAEGRRSGAGCASRSTGNLGSSREKTGSATTAMTIPALPLLIERSSEAAIP